MSQVVDKTVRLQLVGLNGNAFALIAAFQKQAKSEGWTEKEIKSVREEAMSGDYHHLVSTLMDHCENGGFGLDDEDDDDWCDE